MFATGSTAPSNQAQGISLLIFPLLLSDMSDTITFPWNDWIGPAIQALAFLPRPLLACRHLIEAILATRFPL
jgi:hypothetical protein